MAFLRAVGNLIRPIASTVIRAVAPQAAEALRGVAGNVIQDLFSKGAGAVKGFLNNIPLVGPLASGLVDRLAPRLAETAQRLVGTGIDRLLAMITGSNVARPAPGVPGGTVTTPPFSNPTRTEAAVANTPVATPVAPQSSSAASTGVGGAGTDTAGWGVPSSQTSARWDGRGMPDPRRYNMQDPQDAANFQRDMANYQQVMNNISLFFQTLSNVLKAQNDTAQAIGRNVR